MISVLRPDLIDYETNQQFDIVVIAHDLVLPVNQRRQVMLYLDVPFLLLMAGLGAFVAPHAFAIGVLDKALWTLCMLVSPRM